MATSLWVKAGKIVMAAGKAVLCAVCPCATSCCPGEIFPAAVCLKITDDGNCAAALAGANVVLNFNAVAGRWEYTGPIGNLGRYEFGDCLGGGSGVRFVPFNFFVTMFGCYPNPPGNGFFLLSYDILNKHPCDNVNLSDTCTNFCLEQLNGTGSSIQLAVISCPPTLHLHGALAGGGNLNGCFGCGSEPVPVWAHDVTDAAGGC